MKAKAAFTSIRSLFPSPPSLLKPFFTLKNPSFSSSSSSSSSSASTDETLKEFGNSAQIFSKCGCTPDEISKIFLRRPSLIKAELPLLESKLTLLRKLGFTGSHLVKIINCRPRFLSCRIGPDLDERIDFLQSLFGSREILLKAITRNPSLLNYDLQTRIKRCVTLYQEMGISRDDLIHMLLSRPTLIPRTSFDHEKLDYIRRTGLSKDSKMYKYVVSLIAISRLQTIREKVENLEKFGLSVDEVMSLFGRSPLVLTLSVEKVQRNMTFLIGTLKLPANVILHNPFLLYFNLESVMKPRYLLAEKIRSLGLHPQIKGTAMLTALRMKEPRFLKAFITCQAEDVSNELMEFYKNAKGIKRLAVTSKRSVNHGFPF